MRERERESEREREVACLPAFTVPDLDWSEGLNVAPTITAMDIVPSDHPPMALSKSTLPCTALQMPGSLC